MTDRDESKREGSVLVGQSEAELAQDVYRSLAEQSLMGLMILQGMPPRLVAVNRAFAEVLGFSEEELLALSGEEVVELIHPEDVSAALDPYGTVIEGVQEQAVTTFRFQRKDGSERWLEASGSQVRFEGEPAVMALCTDITERRESELALRKSEKQYRLLAENASDIIWTMDMELNATYVSPSEARLRGYTLEEVRAHRFDERLTPESLARASAGIGEAAKAEMQGRTAFPVTGEMDLMRSDGSVLPTETTVSMLRDEHGRPTGFLGVTRDITQRKRIEAERLELEAQMQRAQKLESLGLLVGGIAHDFNNLLHGLITNMSVVRMELPEDSTAVARLDDMSTATRQAADLCRQMLAYAGKGRVLAAPVDVNETVTEMLGLLSASVPAKGVLETELADDLPTLLADVSQLRQVVMNLVTNGAEALGDDGGAIRVRTGTMRCDRDYLKACVLGDEASPGNFVFIEVDDDGEGMDARSVQRMFEPFFSSKFAGRGLGLAAVLGIVRAHRGAVRVESEPGRGTCCRVVLPIVARVPRPEVAVEPEPVELTGDGRMVLVVDDDRLSREGLELVLSMRGFEVITAAGGRAAVEVVEQRGEQLSVVLLDLTMPDLDGVETFRALRALREDLPVVLCSGYGMDEAAERFGDDQAHLAGFLHKPYSPPELLLMLREVFEEAKRGTRSP